MEMTASIVMVGRQLKNMLNAVTKGLKVDNPHDVLKLVASLRHVLPGDPTVKVKPAELVDESSSVSLSPSEKL